MFLLKNFIIPNIEHQRLQLILRNASSQPQNVLTLNRILISVRTSKAAATSSSIPNTINHFTLPKQPHLQLTQNDSSFRLDSWNRIVQNSILDTVTRRTTQCWSDVFQFQLVTSRKLRGNKFTLKRHALNSLVVFYEVRRGQIYVIVSDI